MAESYNAGIVTAYGAAVRGGYTGTYDEFCDMMANSANNAAEADAAADRAEAVLESIPSDYSTLSNDVSDLKADNQQLTGHQGTVFEYGTYYATGVKEDNYVAVKTKQIHGGAIINLADNVYGRILIYDNDTYMGKVNSSQGVDKVSGSWYSFTGEVNVYDLLAKHGGNGFALTVLSNNSDTPTSATAQTWGNNHISIFYGLPYVVSELLGSVNNLPASAVATELTEISGTFTNNYAYDTNGSPVSGTLYNYTTISLIGVTGLLAVNGASWGSTYPLVTFFDENNKIIKKVGVTGNTRYTGKAILIPGNATKMIVNGANDGTGTPYIAKAYKGSGKTQYDLNTNFIKPYGTDIGSVYIGDHPELADLRNYPANEVYNFGYSAHNALSNIPKGFVAQGSFLKYVGSNRPDINNKGYSGYILTSINRAWLGVDTGSEIVWTKINNDYGKILFIGDSYAQGYSHDGNNDGWCEYLADYLGLESGEYAVSANGGASFSNTNNSYASLLSASTITNVTDIVVCGGFNDYPYQYSAITSAISSFITSAKSKYPGVRVHIGCIGWIKQGTGTSAMNDWQDVRTAIGGTVIPAYHACVRYGADYLSNVEYALGDSGLTPTDGYHPSADGNKAIAEAIGNAILTGSAPIPYSASLRAN